MLEDRENPVRLKSHILIFFSLRILMMGLMGVDSRPEENASLPRRVHGQIRRRSIHGRSLETTSFGAKDGWRCSRRGTSLVFVFVFVSPTSFFRLYTNFFLNFLPVHRSQKTRTPTKTTRIHLPPSSSSPAFGIPSSSPLIRPSRTIESGRLLWP